MHVLPDNFLGLPPRWSDYRKARYAVLPIPYDATTSFQTGARRGPRAIVTASQQVELFDEEYGREFIARGIATLPALVADVRGPAEMHETVFRTAKKIVADRKFLLALGGEHSITSGLVRAVHARHKKNLCVLQIDAHADLRDEYEGSPYSHASVMRRVMDLRVPVIPVGIRNYSLEEHRFIWKKKLRVFSARETRLNADWMLQVIDRLAENVYVTIDIDGFDPAYAPGTGTPEPGGLDWYQVTDLLKAVAMARNIVAADVVEVLPLPGSAQTEFFAAKLLYKLIAHIEGNK